MLILKISLAFYIQYSSAIIGNFPMASFLFLVKRRGINISLITLHDVLLSELLTNVLTISSTYLIGLSISVFLQIPRRITFQRLLRGMMNMSHLIIPWLLKTFTSLPKKSLVNDNVRTEIIIIAFNFN